MKAAVLAGGHASRFRNRLKGLERVGGERILDRVVQVILAATGAKPLLIANDPGATDWLPGIEIARDARPDCGSLGGIYTALRHAGEPVFVTAWDMPFLTVDLVQALCNNADGFDVFLPESDGPRNVEPFCSVYTPACISHIERSLDDEDYRATGFHEHVRTGTLPIEKVRTLGDPDVLFFNVNTIDDLEKAEELWRQHV